MFNYKKVIFISDIHFGVHTNKDVWLTMMVDYFNNFFIPLCKEYKSQYQDIGVFILGDVFHNRHSINMKVLDEARKIIRQICDVCDVHILLGNHDIYYLDRNDVNSVVALIDKDIDNLFIYDDVHDVHIKNRLFRVVSWRKDDQSFLDSINGFVGDCILAHADFINFNLNRYQKNIHGISSDEINTRLYSGHIHIRQHHDNVHMIGSPYEMDRNDIGNVKGIYVLDIDTFEHEFIENTISPKYVKINLSEIINLSDNEIINLVTNQNVDLYINNSYITQNDKRTIEVVDIINNTCNIYNSFNISSSTVDIDATTEISHKKLHTVFSELLNDDDQNVDIRDEISEYFNDKLYQINYEY